MEQLKFKGKYFNVNKDAVHVDDDYTQSMIDDVYDSLLKSTEDWDYALRATGDTLIIGTKSIEDCSIDIYVTQDYNEAIICSEDGGKTWEPIDWTVPLEDEEWTKEELMAEILKLQRKLDDYEVTTQNRYPDYNPRKEI